MTTETRQADNRAWFRQLKDRGKAQKTIVPTPTTHDTTEHVSAKPIANSHVSDVYWAVPAAAPRPQPATPEPSHIHIQSKPSHIHVSTRVFDAAQKESVDTKDTSSETLTNGDIKPQYPAPHRRWFHHLMEQGEKNPVAKKSRILSQIANLICDRDLASLFFGPLVDKKTGEMVFPHAVALKKSGLLIPAVALDTKNLSLSTKITATTTRETAQEDFLRFKERIAKEPTLKNTSWEYTILPEPEPVQNNWQNKASRFMQAIRLKEMAPIEHYLSTQREPDPILVAKKPFHPNDFSHDSSQESMVDWGKGLSSTAEFLLFWASSLQARNRLSTHLQGKVTSLISAVEKLQETLG